MNKEKTDNDKKAIGIVEQCREAINDINGLPATDAELLGLAESSLDALKQGDFATAAIALDLIAIELRARG